MQPVRTIDEVFDAIQKTKAGAAEFCTNFYPAPQKLETWIAQNELNIDRRSQAIFFLRKDRDFWHLYFCATNPDALRNGLNNLLELKTERVATDIIGSKETLYPLLPVLENAGLFRYMHLSRMARVTQDTGSSSCDEEWKHGVTYAGNSDADAVLTLIRSSFDPYAKNIPSLREIVAAIDARQVLIVRHHSDLAGLLFFETHGVTSTLRFWAVADGFRDVGVGSLLMRHYLASHNLVRRFVLWVDSDGQDAITKYEHFHYARDGVVDHVLANEWIPR